MFLQYDWNKVKENLKQALDIGWKGILSIFVAMAVIFIVILILNKITKVKNNK